MNSRMEKILAEVTKLDSWDILSILGGVSYLLQRNAINQTINKLPDAPPEGSGIDGYASFAEKEAMPSIREAVAPLVGLADRVKEVLNDYTDAPLTEYDKVYAFLTERPPQRETHVREYDQRKKLGMRPSMPMKDFVDEEHKRALTRFEALKAKGGDAVRILSNLDGTDGNVPEYIYEQIENKISQKLEERWKHAEIRRTNPRFSKEQRDEAEANQMMICTVMKELGYKTPDYSKEIGEADEVDKFVERLSKKATN